VVLNKAFATALCTGLLALGGPASADEYRPDEFLGLDLSSAVLSPTPLGPPASFEQIPIEAKADRASGPPWAREELKTEPPPVATENVTVPHRVAKAASMKPKSSARTHVAHGRRSPLDAQAMDTRVQTWPCKSGGICNWKQ
jgi:hypothetical protein